MLCSEAHAANERLAPSHYTLIGEAGDGGNQMEVLGNRDAERQPHLSAAFREVDDGALDSEAALIKYDDALPRHFGARMLAVINTKRTGLRHEQKPRLR